MKCYILGKQDVSFKDVKGVKLYLKSEAPYIEGYKTGDLWIGSDSQFYDFVSGLNFVGDKGVYKEIAVDIVYDYYLGSKKPSLVAINLL